MASEIFYRRQRYKEDGQQKDKALPSLIVCPSTLVNHWLFEIKKFCPNGLEADAYTGKDAKQRSLLRQRLRDSDDIIVMSYESLRNDVCDLIVRRPQTLVFPLLF
jgi:TATA-binding protein-associated factor